MLPISQTCILGRNAVQIYVNIHHIAKTLIYVKLISLSPFISTLVLIETLYSPEILITIFLSLDVPTFIFCFYLLLRDSS